MLLSYGVGKDSWESVGLQEDQPVNPKGNQSWIFIGSTDAEAEAPILWPPDAKSRLIRKDPDAGKDWRQEELGDGRGWDGWMVSLTQRTCMCLSKLWELVRDREAWHASVHEVAKSWTGLGDWTEYKKCNVSLIILYWLHVEMAIVWIYWVK